MVLHCVEPTHSPLYYCTLYIYIYYFRRGVSCCLPRHNYSVPRGPTERTPFKSPIYKKANKRVFLYKLVIPHLEDAVRICDASGWIA